MSVCRLILLSAVVMMLSAVALTEGMRYKAKTNICCISYNPRPLKVHMVSSYSLSGLQCSKQAVIFTTKKGKDVCANPSDHWVKTLIKILDKTSGNKGPL